MIVFHIFLTGLFLLVWLLWQLFLKWFNSFKCKSAEASGITKYFFFFFSKGNFLPKIKTYRAIEFLTSKAELDTAVPLGIKLLRQLAPWNFAAEEYVKVSTVKLDYTVNATNMFWRSTALAFMEGWLFLILWWTFFFRNIWNLYKTWSLIKVTGELSRKIICWPIPALSKWHFLLEMFRNAERHLKGTVLTFL